MNALVKQQGYLGPKKSSSKAKSTAFTDELKLRIAGRKTKDSDTVTCVSSVKLGNCSENKSKAKVNTNNDSFTRGKLPPAAKSKPTGGIRKNFFENLSNEACNPLQKVGEPKALPNTRPISFKRPPHGPSHRLPPSAYNPFRSAFQEPRSSNPSIHDPSETQPAEGLHNAQLKDNYQGKTKCQRPAKAYQLDQDDLACSNSKSGVSEVAKMVAIFERANYRKRDQLQRDDSSKQNLLDKGGSSPLARDEKRLEVATALSDHDTPSRHGKIRKMVKMFDPSSAPVYKSNEPLAEVSINTEVMKESPQENLLSNSNADLCQSYTPKTNSLYPSTNLNGLREPSISILHQNQSKFKTENESVVSMDHDQDHTQESIDARQSQTQLPSFMKNGRKPAWMLGDNIEVQLDVQHKWDVVNRQIRAKIKHVRSETTTEQSEDQEMEMEQS